MNNGELSKIVIKAFKDKKLTVAADGPNVFVLPVNPEQYNQNMQVDYDTKKGQGNQGTNARYKSTKPKELKIEFLFDGTNTIEGYNTVLAKMPVREQIKLFTDTVYSMNGTIHKPNYLKILWGEQFTYNCVLSNVDINYLLFKAAGEPLRAKVKASFTEYKESERRVKEEDKESPDLTHVRQVKGGDSLHLMSYKIYGNSKFYLQLAKVNQLTSFRNLKPGTQIIFPPIQKTSNE